MAIIAAIIFCVSIHLMAYQVKEEREIAKEWSEWRAYARENQCIESEVSPGFWSCEKPGPGKTYWIVKGHK